MPTTPELLALTPRSQPLQALVAVVVRQVLAAKARPGVRAAAGPVETVTLAPEQQVQQIKVTLVELALRQDPLAVAVPEQQDSP